MPRKKKKEEKPKPSKSAFHEGLEGFDIKVNSFGQMETTFEIDKLNQFLNEEKIKAEEKAEAEAKDEAKDEDEDEDEEKAIPIFKE